MIDVKKLIAIAICLSASLGHLTSVQALETTTNMVEKYHNIEGCYEVAEKDPKANIETLNIGSGNWAFLKYREGYVFMWLMRKYMKTLTKAQRKAFEGKKEVGVPLHGPRIKKIGLAMDNVFLDKSKPIKQREEIDVFTSQELFNGTAYKAAIDEAKKRGYFPIFSENSNVAKSGMQIFLRASKFDTTSVRRIFIAFSDDKKAWFNKIPMFSKPRGVQVAIAKLKKTGKWIAVFGSHLAPFLNMIKLRGLQYGVIVDEVEKAFNGKLAEKSRPANGGPTTRMNIKVSGAVFLADANTSNVIYKNPLTTKKNAITPAILSGNLKNYQQMISLGKKAEATYYDLHRVFQSRYPRNGLLTPQTYLSFKNFAKTLVANVVFLHKGLTRIVNQGLLATVFGSLGFTASPDPHNNLFAFFSPAMRGMPDYRIDQTGFIVKDGTHPFKVLNTEVRGLEKIVEIKVGTILKKFYNYFSPSDKALFQQYLREKFPKMAKKYPTKKKDWFNKMRQDAGLRTKVLKHEISDHGMPVVKLAINFGYQCGNKKYSSAKRKGPKAKKITSKGPAKKKNPST